MPVFSLRPTFVYEIDVPKQLLISAILQKLDEPSWDWVDHRFDGYFEFHVPKEETRYWSPHLALSFDEVGGKAKVHGRLAPRQEVWTLVWVAYLAFSFCAFFALLFAISASLTRTPTVTWWLIPLCLLGIFAIYSVSYVGQSWSRDQMDQLRTQCDRLIQESAEIARMGAARREHS